MKEIFLQTLLDSCLEKLKKEIHKYPLPGRHKKVFENFLVPKIIEMNKDLQDSFLKHNYLKLKSTNDGLYSLRKITEFLLAAQKTYLRPFPPLGSTLASLGTMINSWMDKADTPLELFLNNLTVLFFHGHNISFVDLINAGSFSESYVSLRRIQNCSARTYNIILQNVEELRNPCFQNDTEPCCNLYHDVSINEHLETFLEIMKHTINADFESLKEKTSFFDKFAEIVLSGKSLNSADPSVENMNRFLFCDFSSDLKTSSMGCKKMIPIPTGNGLCHSFNSLPATEIYQDSYYSNAWNSIFGGKNNSKLEYPTSWGPSRPLYIVVQSFEPQNNIDAKNFLLSFTNEFNAFDASHESFEIMPGYQHTFRVIPSIVSTTPRFDELGLKERGCRLMRENGEMNLFKRYSKRGCEFECAIKASYNACNCLPWSTPRSQRQFRTCDMIGNRCFKNMLNLPQVYENCNCLNDCRAVAYGISESTRPLNLHNLFMRSKALYRPITNWISTACKHYYLYFASDPRYNAEVDKTKYLFQNHLSIIKVEMGTKSVIKSVRDVKATFEYQLSAIGMFDFLLFCLIFAKFLSFNL